MPDCLKPPNAMLKSVRNELCPIVPALRNSDDATAIKAVDAFEKLIEHLQTVDMFHCVVRRARSGYKTRTSSTPKARRCFRRHWKHKKVPIVLDRKLPRVPNRPTRSSLHLQQAGFTDRDFDELSSFDKLPAAAGCSLTVKLWMSPSPLPAPKRAVLARYLLTMS